MIIIKEEEEIFIDILKIITIIGDIFPDFLN
jgi:hypothetical protein